MTDSLSSRNRFSGEQMATNLPILRPMPETDPKSVGERLRAVMADPDLGVETVDDFAKLVGADRSAASNWLNGYNLPRVPCMGRLIERSPDLTLDWIYFGTPDRIPLKTYIKLQALMERVRVPVVPPEPPEQEPPEPAVKEARRLASRKRATSLKRCQ
jgi:hypothetical protein